MKLDAFSHGGTSTWAVFVLFIPIVVYTEEVAKPHEVVIALMGAFLVSAIAPMLRRCTYRVVNVPSPIVFSMQMACFVISLVMIEIAPAAVLPVYCASMLFDTQPFVVSDGIDVRAMRVQRAVSIVVLCVSLALPNPYHVVLPVAWYIVGVVYMSFRSIEGESALVLAMKAFDSAPLARWPATYHMLVSLSSFLVLGGVLVHYMKPIARNDQLDRADASHASYSLYLFVSLYATLTVIRWGWVWCMRRYAPGVVLGDAGVDGVHHPTNITHKVDSDLDMDSLFTDDDNDDDDETARLTSPQTQVRGLGDDETQPMSAAAISMEAQIERETEVETDEPNPLTTQPSRRTHSRRVSYTMGTVLAVLVLFSIVVNALPPTVTAYVSAVCGAIYLALVADPTFSFSAYEIMGRRTKGDGRNNSVAGFWILQFAENVALALAICAVAILDMQGFFLASALSMSLAWAVSRKARSL